MSKHLNRRISLAKKDEEITELKKKLAGHSSHSPTSSIHSVALELGDSRHPSERVGKRRGKAPPVDNLTGEDPELRFEDWLPALERAARWNEWSSEETLIQLAGHLRGRALQAGIYWKTRTRRIMMLPSKLPRMF